MSRRFPKIDAGDFPHVGNVDVFDGIEFDYSRYEGSSKRISLHSVAWDSSYTDVVAFDDEDSRDEWFASHRGARVDLSTAVQRVPRQSVRVPLPYNAAVAYNYATIDLPVLTSAGKPLDYEDRKLEKVCFFISDAQYLTPSVTELYLELDVWQTYSYKMDVRSMMLAQGHAPMRELDADAYLRDPHANCANLTAREPEEGERADDVRALEVADMSRGDKMLVLALPLDAGAMASLEAGEQASSTPPVFSDEQRRDGYQLRVSGYEWAPSGARFGETALDANYNPASGAGIIDQFRLYAVDTESAARFLEAASKTIPHVVAAIRFAAVMPKALIRFSGEVMCIGYRLHIVDQSPLEVAESVFELDKSKWGYPSDIADIAKLYTWPYSYIEMTDDDGNAHEIRIEDIEGSRLSVSTVAALSSLALKVRSFPVNLGASGGIVLDWKTLDGSSKTAFVKSDFVPRLIEWDIPTYSLQVLSGRLKAARDSESIERDRQDALLRYRQSVRPANTSHMNTLDSDATSRANQGRTNTTNTANTDATNATNTANTALSNQARTDAKDANNTTRNNVNSTQNSTLTHNTIAGNNASSDRKKTANDLQAASTDATNDATSISGMVNAGSQLMGGAMSLASGDVMGVIGAAAGAVGTTITTLNAITKNQTISDAIETANFMSNAIAIDEASNLLEIATAHNNTVTGCANGNATDQANIANQRDTQLTANGNSLASTTTANNNALGTANTNATTATNDSNSGFTRGNAIEAAQENLAAAQARAEASYSGLDSTLARAGADGAFSDLDAFNRRAIVFRVKTQDKGAIRRAGDRFKRYGYSLDAAWEFEKWALGDYCYWRCDEIKISGEMPESARMSLRAIASQGFTAWKDPERVGYYD